MFTEREAQTFDICEFCRYNPPSSFGGRPCTVCPASGREIKTNADRIKAMSDEELARWQGRAREAENALEKVGRILCNPLIVEQVVNGKPTLRPVKDTSRQDVYRTVLLAQAAIKINYRRIPKRLYPEWVSRELDELGKEC